MHIISVKTVQQVVVSDTDNSVQCKCRHFSGFTVSAYPPSISFVKVIDTNVSVGESKDGFVGLFLLTLLSVFIIFGIVANFIDKKDDMAVSTYFLNIFIPLNLLLLFSTIVKKN